MSRERGFTLVELMIVVVIVAILAAIAIPQYQTFRTNSIRSSCVSNQRNIVQGATLYALENNAPDAVLNVTVLQSGGYINTDPSECPSSALPDLDDYTVTITSMRVASISCDVEASAHNWAAIN